MGRGNLSFVLKLEAQVRGLAGASALFVTAVACNHFDHHTVVDLAMTSAYRPADVEFNDLKEHGPGSADPDEVAAHFQILAGDFHCHVSPPDWNQEANRDLAETVVLAKKEHLDFVVLTPHVRARFFSTRVTVAESWTRSPACATRSPSKALERRSSSSASSTPITGKDTSGSHSATSRSSSRASRRCASRSARRTSSKDGSPAAVWWS